MAHYDCRHCGEFGCFGECKTEENQAAKRAEEARLALANKWKAVLQKEEKRISDLEKARAFFLLHDEKGNMK
ncbi:hypothetical protein VPHK567_0134 [Vibrio phage K567]|nr:hypothetical protein MYOV011v1_p0074 [Vibrio phage 6E35.1a]